MTILRKFGGRNCLVFRLFFAQLALCPTLPFLIFALRQASPMPQKMMRPQ